MSQIALIPVVAICLKVIEVFGPNHIFCKMNSWLTYTSNKAAWTRTTDKNENTHGNSIQIQMLFISVHAILYCLNMICVSRRSVLS